jgi:hypothetical protein
MGLAIIIILFYCGLSLFIISIILIYNFIQEKFFPRNACYIPFYWGFIIPIFLILIRVLWIEFFGVWVN